jgi:hypothetical protein
MITDERIKQALVSGDYEVVANNKTCHRIVSFTREQASMFDIEDKDTLLIDGKRINVEVSGLWKIAGDSENG